MGFEKPSGLIKPSKAGCGILPDIQSCTSVDDFASTCIIFGSKILFPLVWGMVMCNNVFKTEKIEVKPKIKKSEKYFKHLKENVLLLI